jgi:predicted XRE-type DNA-binding protein
MDKPRKPPTFEDFWQEVEAEARAERPAAVAQLERMAHRFRIGGELSVLRHRRQLTQAELAELTGIDQGEISKIERGVSNATEDTLARLARALGAELAIVPAEAAI